MEAWKSQFHLNILYRAGNVPPKKRKRTVPPKKRRLPNEGEEDEETCAICHEPYTDPVVACSKCKTTFCRNCIRGHIEIRQRNRQAITCPNCRGFIDTVCRMISDCTPEKILDCQNPDTCAPHLINALKKWVFSNMKFALSGKDYVLFYTLLTRIHVQFNAAEYTQLLFEIARSPDQDERSAVYETIQNIIRHLIESGADINAVQNELSPLFVAVGVGHVNATRVLLEAGAKVEGTQRGGTALIFAAMGGHDKIARYLLKAGAGASLNATTSNGFTALMIAAMHGHAQVARVMIEAGAKVESKNNIGVTALMLSAQNGHERVARVMLENGADVNAAADSGSTALILAAENGHEDVVSLLIDRDASVNHVSDDGFTALMIAAGYNREQMAQFLIAKGASPDLRNIAGKNASEIAKEYGHTHLSDLLNSLQS
jgi:ankyrin repeat protein